MATGKSVNESHFASMDFALPLHPIQTRQSGEREEVYDPVRQQWVAMAGEEFVRQLLLQHLLLDRGISRGRIAVERELAYHDLRKRFDVVVFGRNGHPWLLCECKSPEIPITEDTIYQAGRYNYTLAAPGLLLTNGVQLLLYDVGQDGKLQARKSWFEEVD